MQIFILERVPPGLRGELTRWMLELRAGVFVGNVSAMVRDRLWDDVCRRSKGGSAMLVHSAGNEQGYAMRLWGDPSYHLEEFEGLWLVRRPDRRVPEPVQEGRGERAGWGEVTEGG